MLQMHDFCACRMCKAQLDVVFFFNDTATTEIYTLSLHDALPISPRRWNFCGSLRKSTISTSSSLASSRSEEHTSELQSHSDLVCRLLLEKKKNESGLLCTDRATDVVHTREHLHTPCPRTRLVLAW